MKKTFLLCALICALGMMTSCEQISTIVLTINNQSEYNVVVEYSSVNRPHAVGGYERGWSDTIRAYSSLDIFCEEKWGYTEKDYSEKNLVHFFGDSVTFIVDGIRLYTYYSSDTTSDNSPYNFNSPHYSYSENGRTYTNHTYTITAEQVSPMQ